MKIMRKKLRARDLPIDDLPYDMQRRLRNAVLALVSLDPHWMFWIEKNIPPRKVERHHLQLIEIRARALVLHGYSFAFSDSQRIRMIFSEMPFNDRGALQQI